MSRKKNAGAKSLPTIYDVAAEAGVSKSTVSRVLRGDNRVSSTTIETVHKAMETLHYVPATAARTMRSNGEKTVGLLLRNVDSASYAHLNKHLHLALQEKGYRVVQETVVGKYPDEEAALQHLLGLRVAAILVASGTISSDVLARYRSNVPLVVVARQEPDLTLHNVAYDHVGHGHMSVDFLHDLGHRNIIIQTVPWERSRGSHTRAEAAKERAAELGIEFREHDAEGSTSYDELIENVILSSRPTAMICVHDRCLIDAMRTLQRYGLRVPEDISLSGADGLLDGVDVFGVSTVRLPVEALARDTADVTAGLIEGELDDDSPQRRVHTGWLLQGRTVRRV